MHSHRGKEGITQAYLRVLILVVMEDALARSNPPHINLHMTVLILVVMEDALAPEGEPCSKQRILS